MSQFSFWMGMWNDASYLRSMSTSLFPAISSTQLMRGYTLPATVSSKAKTWERVLPSGLGLTTVDSCEVQDSFLNPLVSLASLSTSFSFSLVPVSLVPLACLLYFPSVMSYLPLLDIFCSSSSSSLSFSGSLCSHSSSPWQNGKYP